MHLQPHGYTPLSAWPSASHVLMYGHAKAFTVLLAKQRKIHKNVNTVQTPINQINKQVNIEEI